MAGVPRFASTCHEGPAVMAANNWCAHAGHLARRFVGALSRRAPDAIDAEWASGFLLPGEMLLWRRLSNPDKRHSIEVARRFAEDVGETSRDDMAAALLHDVGKLCSGLGTFARVCATVVGPRTRRFRLYHDHERLGADLMREAGSTAQSLALIDETSDRRDVVSALRRADHV